MVRYLGYQEKLIRRIFKDWIKIDDILYDRKNEPRGNAIK